MDWSGKITYQEPVHNSKESGCTCSSTGNPKSCALTKVYAANKKAGKRVCGVLTGNNRMGKYLMAIRSEVRLLNGIGGIVVKKEEEVVEKPAKKQKKSPI